MYRYDEFDETIVRERIDQFRGQVARRLSGELTEDQFKPLRLMNGLYLQLHAYMLRVAVPYGTLSSGQLNALADIADRYDKGYGHFTTRQNIQFNWPALVDVPAILDDLAAVEMHAMQTSGNCIRNVTTDQYAGAAADEIEDPRPWCEAIRQWSTLHPEFSFLPRKFKIAVTASATDRAAVRVHDIGLQMVRDADGAAGFRVIVGGGLGRTPYIGDTLRDFLPKEHLLSYLEAILRVYNEQGRRDNMYKARIKILVNALGIDAFRNLVEEEWGRLDKHGVDLPTEETARIAAYFAPPVFNGDAGATIEGVAAAAPPHERAAFERWLKINTAPHKTPGRRIVNVSLKPIGGAPGDATSGQMRAVAHLAHRYGADEIRVTHEQNLCMPHIAVADLPAVWRALDAAGLATANIALASDIIACPGLDYCALATARSIPLAQQIATRVAAREGGEETLGELKIKISGCVNACGHHHVGNIGILGVDKRGEEFYQITLGGSAADDAAIGERVGPALPTSGVLDAVDALLDVYQARRAPGERFLDAYRRLGAEPFKEALYDHADA
ncbi:MAG: nitrite/sulfite reductase [Pseudomonadota bacterium]